MAQEIGKQLGGHNVLNRVSLQVSSGEVVVLLGPNGAGKSTLLKILTLLLKPTTGRLYIDGEQVGTDSAEARSKIGAMLHAPLLYDGLTAAENLRFYGRLYGLPALEQRIDEVLEDVGLKYHARELVRIFSQGMRQRLALARAMLHRPRLLLLDEPFAGLDISACDRLAAQLVRYKSEGVAVLLITHQWEHLPEVTDRALVLKSGRIVAELTPPGDQPDWLQRRYREAVGLT